MYIGFSPALHLQCGSSSPLVFPLFVDFLNQGTYIYKSYGCYTEFFLDGNISSFGAKRECIQAFLRAPIYHYSPVLLLLCIVRFIQTRQHCAINKKMANISCKTRFRHRFFEGLQYTVA